MRCHYCGYAQPRVDECPECGSRHIGEFRAGTQQIEEIVKETFPGARVLRMDMDTTRQKDAHEKILSAFANEEADILVGTQMIVKGHDFPNVTLVGVLAADMSLYTDDYRSGERTFQLLTQAAGRAGRGERHGRGGDPDIQSGSLCDGDRGGAGLRSVLRGRDPVPGTDGLPAGGKSVWRCLSPARMRNCWRKDAII